MYSLEVYGEVMPMTYESERYVATRMIETWLANGYTIADIPLIWNQGSNGQCRRGVNRHGVRYDSCAYQQKVLALLN